MKNTLVTALAAGALLLSLSSCSPLGGGPESSAAGASSGAGSGAPSAPASEAEIDDERVEALLGGMTLRQKICQMILVTPVTLETGIRQEAEDSTAFTAEQRATLERYPVGGVVFFSGNIGSGDQIRQYIADLQAHSTTGLLIAVDEEGGRISRLAGKPGTGVGASPPMAEIGEGGDPQVAYDHGDALGRALSALGFNLDFAPVADINTNPHNPVIGDRAFGSTAEAVSPMVAQVVRGLQAQGVSACLKHFPGHGDTSADTHTGMAAASADLGRLRAVEFLPFKAGIDAGADLVMVAHVELPNAAGDGLPASMSPFVVTGLLRGELGYRGVIVTDALDMGAISDYYGGGEAAVRCVEAGVDLLCMPGDLAEAYGALEGAVLRGDIPESRIDQSVRRILALKLRRGILS